MKALCIAMAASALLASPSFGGQDAATPVGSRPDQSAAQSATASYDAARFRDDLDRIFGHYRSLFEKIGHARGLQLAEEGRAALRALTDEQVAGVFTGTRVPDLTLAVQGAEQLDAMTPAARGGGPGAQGRTPGFPNKPEIPVGCFLIPHDPLARFAAMTVYHTARTILETAKYGCLQNLPPPACVNNSWVCITLAIAKNAGEIAVDLMNFCAGEEDSALLEGNYARLAHIHGDVEAALAAILTRIDQKAAEIMANDDANRRMLTREMRNLSCDLLRIMHTPEGLRQSSIESCVGQPNFPYNFPEH